MSASIYTMNSEFNRAVRFVAQEFFYLYIERRWNGTLEFYNGKTWEKIEANDEGYDGKRIPAIKFPQGYTVYVRGKNNTNITGYYNSTLRKWGGKQWKFLKKPIDPTDEDSKVTGYPNAWMYPDFNEEVACGGNLKYLIDYEIDDRPAGSSPISLNEYCFAWMFYNFSYDTEDRAYPYKLISAPGLPSESEVKINSCCYEGTFSKCNSLTLPPKLPNATAYGSYSMMFSNSGIIKTPKFPTVDTSSSCYLGMFENCYNLKFAEDLPSTRVYSNAYTTMFVNCTSLSKPPKIKARTFEPYSCSWMFSGSGLEEAPILPHGEKEEEIQYPSHCFEGMFNDCTSLIGVPVLEANYYGDYCCSWMFRNCNVKVTRPDPSTDYPTKWEIVNHGSVQGENPLNQILKEGLTLSLNTNYYLHKDNHIVQPDPLD